MLYMSCTEGRLYPAVGGLGNQEQTEVVTILEKSEYAKLLAFIHETDQSAFVTVSTVSEVIGEWNKHKEPFEKSGVVEEIYERNSIII